MSARRLPRSRKIPKNQNAGGQVDVLGQQRAEEQRPRRGKVEHDRVIVSPDSPARADARQRGDQSASPFARAVVTCGCSSTSSRFPRMMRMVAAVPRPSPRSVSTGSLSDPTTCRGSTAHPRKRREHPTPATTCRVVATASPSEAPIPQIRAQPGSSPPCHRHEVHPDHVLLPHRLVETKCLMFAASRRVDLARAPSATRVVRVSRRQLHGQAQNERTGHGDQPANDEGCQGGGWPRYEYARDDSPGWRCCRWRLVPPGTPQLRLTRAR